jgi:ABC-type multidrug transport system ATPase subunit
VAAALLKDPELVVLDEPTNGLDPAGMRDMRRLVRRLGEEGRTVLLSSHPMAEVQQICDRVAVIDRGRIIAESSVEEFSKAVKGAREDAAARLSRELDRAVAQFSHDAQAVLGDRLAKVSDAGAARVDRMLREIVGAIEQRRDEFLNDFQRRFGDVEIELRSQIRGIAAEAEAEREVLDARVRELTRRLENAVVQAESSPQGAF